MNEEEIRQALGIDEAADPVVAIAEMRAELSQLKQTIAADPKTAASAEVTTLRSDLTKAKQSILSMRGEMDRRLAEINDARRNDQAVAKVEGLVARGKIKPAERETALDIALHLSADRFDEYVNTLHGVDFTERGVASSVELEDMAPTASEISVAKQMGNWDDNDSAGSRMKLMRAKARDKGLTIPQEAK